jgi:hypothetical protein
MLKSKIIAKNLRRMCDTMAYRNNIPREQRIILGCKANVGENVSELSQEYNTNRQFVYTQKTKVQELLDDEFDVPPPPVPCIQLDKNIIEKIIFGCMVICKGSIEDTQKFIESIFHKHLSIGSISNIINAIAVKAKEFNDSVSLEEIKTGAHDEIFQASKAVLVGVEPQSTYVYLMEESDTIDGTAWGCALLDKQKKGLNIETSLNDAGTGLIKGVQEAFPGVIIQGDVFHAERKVSECMYSAERAAYKAIRHEYALEYKYTNSRENKKHRYLQEYREAVLQSELAIGFYDKINILYTWMKEAFQIAGYSFEERKYILHFVISELEALPMKKQKLTAAITYLITNQDSLLQFVKNIGLRIKVFADEERIDENSISLMWEQLRYPVYSKQYNNIEVILVNTLKDQYTYLRNKFQEFTHKTVRASSIVECINSLIRPYLSLKRAVYGNFLPLVQFYLNTRKYRRSGRKERVGKSPIELLTQRKYPSPLDILEF